MSRRRIFVGAISTAILTAVAALIWYYRPRSPIEVLPVPPNPYVESYRLERLDGEPVADVVEVRPGTGFYAILTAKLADDAPKTYEGRKISDAIHWSATLALYPRTARNVSRETFEWSCGTFKPKGMLRRGAKEPDRTNGKPHPPWRGRIPTHCGHTGEPKLSKPLPKGDICRYTYFAVGDHPPGEYVYELRVYPTARWISWFRCEHGTPLVLQRGLLKVSDGDA